MFHVCCIFIRFDFWRFVEPCSYTVQFNWNLAVLSRYSFIYVGGHISGGLLNPAVTLCNSTGTLQFFQDTLPIIHVGGHSLGGVLLGLVFRFVTHGHKMQQPEDGGMDEVLIEQATT